MTGGASLWLLDANAAIAAINNPDGPVARRVQATAEGSVVLSAVVLHELAFGAHRSARFEANRARVRGLRFPVLPFDGDAAWEAARVRAVLASRGAPIGPFDTLIAGHALALGATVVTNDTREFRRVPDLRVEDWSEGP